MVESLAASPGRFDRYLEAFLDVVLAGEFREGFRTETPFDFRFFAAFPFGRDDAFRHRVPLYVLEGFGDELRDACALPERFDRPFHGLLGCGILDA